MCRHLTLNISYEDRALKLGLAPSTTITFLFFRPPFPPCWERTLLESLLDRSQFVFQEEIFFKKFFFSFLTFPHERKEECVLSKKLFRPQFFLQHPYTN